jgi:hypothetical protein
MQYRCWRRKAGVATLVMACALTISWARSYQAQEMVWVQISNVAVVCFHTEGRFLLARGEEDPKRSINFDWESIPHYAIAKRDAPQPFWRLDKDGAMAPHWVIIMSLTLLSAYLILWKPRKRAK